MLSCRVTLRERLHRGGDLSAGGDCGSRRVLVRVRRCRGRRGRLLSVRQLVGRQVDDAVRARAVQAAEDIQSLVLAPVEVQTQDGREDEQHHGEVKHDHNGCLRRETKKEKKQSEKSQRTVCEITDTTTQLGRVRAPSSSFFFFLVSQTTAQRVKKSLTLNHQPGILSEPEGEKKRGRRKKRAPE